MRWYLDGAHVATESLGGELMSGGKQECLFLLKSVQTFQVIIPSLDVFLAFDLCGDQDEIFRFEVPEVQEFLMVDLNIWGFGLNLRMFLFGCVVTHSI